MRPPTHRSRGPPLARDCPGPERSDLAGCRREAALWLARRCLPKVADLIVQAAHGPLTPPKLPSYHPSDQVAHGPRRHRRHAGERCDGGLPPPLPRLQGDAAQLQPHRWGCTPVAPRLQPFFLEPATQWRLPPYAPQVTWNPMHPACAILYIPGDVGCAALASSLGALGVLEVLELQDCGLGDAAACALADALTATAGGGASGGAHSLLVRFQA